MSVGNYNVPSQYKVDKGLPIEFLGQKIKDEKCKEIFEEEVQSLQWCFQIVDDEILQTGGSLTGKKGISVFEVQLRHEISAELMTEIIAGMIPRRMLLCFICKDRMALSAYIPGEYGLTPRLQVSDYESLDTTHSINIWDAKEDSKKDYQEIHRRMLRQIREQKRVSMIEQAFTKIQKEKKKVKDEFDFLFSQENLDKIREDAEFVEEQLRTF